MKPSSESTEPAAVRKAQPWAGASIASPNPAAPSKSRHRSDIQGLRAILMIQVLLFHAWQIGSPIGVDAFIMVSAFLMTSSFVRRSEAGRMPFFIERWGNTFKRLLPPLVITVLLTLGGSVLLLPQSRWREITVEAFASLTYWENWRLAQVATDYYAADQALASPFQHLWSMSMQGQVFLLWPFIMTACVLFARRANLRIRSVVFVAFTALMLASLLWLLLYAPDNSSIYFDTRARIWEFAFGSAIAAWAPRNGFTGHFARFLAWAGFLVLILFSLVSIGTYPGPMALIPMAAVSAILLYRPGQSTRRFDVTKVLSARPLTALGDMSYSVYLVHWPVFVFFLASVGRPRLDLAEGALLIGLSILLSWLLTKFVDDPLRRWRWANRSTSHKWAVVAVSLFIGLTPVGLFYYWLSGVEDRQESAAEALDGWSGGIPAYGPGSNAHPGARALLGEVEPDFVSPPIPGPLALSGQWATFDDECSTWVKRNLVVEKSSFCTAFGDHLASEAKVLIAGNSHAQQLLLPMTEPLLEQNNWSAEAILRGACAWGAADSSEEGCAQHNQTIRDYVDVLKPDYAFLMVTRTTVDSPDETLIPGVRELIVDLTAEGITVIGLTDNLRSEKNLYECSDKRDRTSLIGGCKFAENDYFAPENPGKSLEDIPGFHLIDLRDAYCVQGECPTIIGNVFVYMDKNHVSNSYASSMAPFFAERFRESTSMP